MSDTYRDRIHAELSDLTYRGGCGWTQHRTAPTTAQQEVGGCDMASPRPVWRLRQAHVTTVLDVAFWGLPALTVTVLIARNEHRIHTTKQKRDHQ
jgi:hypothetical protein